MVDSTELRGRLAGLARNFRWVWDIPTQEVFAQLDAHTWRRTRDPLALVRGVPDPRLAQLAGDGAFLRRLRAAEDDLAGYLGGKPDRPRVAYFCMEHGIAPELRSYAGGLGMLAGCIEKTASDLGVPMVAVGLMYQWFFRQRLDHGWQQEDWQRIDPHAAGLQPVPDVRVTVELAGESAAVRVWRAEVGRLDLYLLDTNVPENPPHLREVADRLYGGDREHRLRQEIVLGVGGVRVLRALGMRPAVFHANEGHAGFVGLERIRELVGAGLPVEGAVRRVRQGSVFTTHTAVPAGFDLFERTLMEKYFTDWVAECGVSTDWLMDLGHFPDQHADEPFNMAVLCARLSGEINAVSKLHREITEERVLGPLWTDRPSPLVAVTNGVHPRTWTPPEMAALFARYVGPDWDYAGAADWARITEVPDEELWRVRQAQRAELVHWVRDYLRRPEVLDPAALIVVVARRAAEYKETDLLVSMPERLAALTGDPNRPVNLVVSGLAHPQDAGGKERIRRIASYAQDPRVRSRVVFLPGYDMRVAQVLLAGADVWLNHPRRGDEACGTSFMKSVYSGGQVVSTADGGADELIVHGFNGWFIGDRTFGVSRERMARDAFAVLEQVVVPRFFDRDPDGVPHAWVAGIKQSLASLAPQVSSAPMVRAYEQLYRNLD